VRQPEERKNSECPRGCMNIGSVEVTGAFRSASREAEDGENNNRDVLISESILAVKDQYVCCCCFMRIHNIIYNLLR
jgi:hypothetical protein